MIVIERERERGRERKGRKIAKHDITKIEGKQWKKREREREDKEEKEKEE